MGFNSGFKGLNTGAALTAFSSV